MVLEINIHHIRPNPMQPRQNFSQESLEELSQSILEYGLLQPILLCNDTESTQEEHYIIVAGERRWRACQMANFSTIPAIILSRQQTQQLREIALIENIQREDLNPIELAQCYKELIQTHQFTHDELAKKVSKSRTQITNTLRLLNLEPNVIQALLENKISQGHAKIIVSAQPKQQEEILQSILNQKLNVHETESLIRNLKNTKAGEKREKDKTPNATSPIKIQIMQNEQKILDFFENQNFQAVFKGKTLCISFKNDEEMEKFAQYLQELSSI
ncbi:hypothetical protein CCZ01_07725 [Helicobacter monodelphidis]|nr:hypothetical protein CCZ01_07725 [Helicobacter sp. 15-1451]